MSATPRNTPRARLLLGAFELPTWDRYQVIELVGQGGMGRVYKAFDPRLKRYVALKFLRQDDTEMRVRLMNEAQAQARIQHEHICEIHEVGEVQGHVYIAMHFIEGIPLTELSGKLSIEQKVQVIRDAAKALHAAHRLGLIHRDVKPANVLVERREGGVLHPYIVDFGLVRDTHADTMTQSGTALGTPSYMSPEQARGDLNRIDRRSDIYSLGVTFYELLTGASPYEANSNLEILLKLVDEDPVPVRKRDSRIPEDLETIIAKCLEKEPNDRYESAKALAEDFQRYLDGEAILARPTGWAYRLKKKIKKHKAISIILSISLLLVGTLAVFALRARWNAAEQAAVAQRFGEEIEKIEAIMRYAYLLPLHDVRSEQALVLGRMKQIQIQINQMTPAQQAPGYYALGRGYLSLHQYEKAKEELERARSMGYATPEVNYALGLTLGAFYRRGLEAAERETGKELKDARRKQVEKEYRIPALEYLEAGASAQFESISYGEGLILFYQKHYDKALERLQRAVNQAPWFYEAEVLKGQVFAALGNQARDKGQTQSAAQLYEKAEKTYLSALNKARSDESIYQALCNLHWDKMNLLLYQSGESLEKDFQDGMKTCDGAMTANPSNSEALNLEAMLTWRWGEYQMNHGVDPRATLNRAALISRRVAKLDPDNSDAYNSEGFALRLRGDYEVDHGVDATPTFDQAIASFRKTVAKNPTSANGYINLGGALWSKGEYQRSRGIDPKASYLQAVEIYAKATELNRNIPNLYNSLGVANWSLSEYEIDHGRDPTIYLQQALQSFHSSYSINPTYALPYDNGGGVLKVMADYFVDIGKDPEPVYVEATRNYQKAIEINPAYSYAYNNFSDMLVSQAEYELESGIDPQKTLQKAQTILTKTLELNADYPEPHITNSTFYVLNARLQFSKGASPADSFRKAEQSVDRALHLNADSPEVYRAYAQLYRRIAEWKFVAKENPEPYIRKGLEATQKGLSIQPGYPELIALEGVFYLLRSDTSAGRLRIQAALLAQTSFENAIRLNANLKRRYDPLLNRARSTRLKAASLGTVDPGLNYDAHDQQSEKE